jgi:hypothetical protein
MISADVKRRCSAIARKRMTFKLHPVRHIPDSHFRLRFPQRLLMTTMETFQQHHLANAREHGTQAGGKKKHRLAGKRRLIEVDANHRTKTVFPAIDAYLVRECMFKKVDVAAGAAMRKFRAFFLNHLSHQRRAFVSFGRGRESDYCKGDDESELIHDCLVLIGAGSGPGWRWRWRGISHPKSPYPSAGGTGAGGLVLILRPAAQISWDVA